MFSLSINASASAKPEAAREGLRGRKAGSPCGFHETSATFSSGGCCYQSDRHVSPDRAA